MFYEFYWSNSGLSEDLTNDSNTEFLESYHRFRKIVNDGDERIANILRCYLQPCDQTMIHLDPIYRVISQENLCDDFMLVFFR